MRGNYIITLRFFKQAAKALRRCMERRLEAEIAAAVKRHKHAE